MALRIKLKIYMDPPGWTVVRKIVSQRRQNLQMCREDARQWITWVRIIKAATGDSVHCWFIPVTIVEEI